MLKKKNFLAVVLCLVFLFPLASTCFAATSNVTKVSITNVTVNDGFATAIINVQISLKNNRYSISKTTFNPVKTNKTSLQWADNCKCLSSNIASGGSSATIKYLYKIWYWSNSYGGNPVYGVSANYDGTSTFQVNMKINSGTGKLTAVTSKVK